MNIQDIEQMELEHESQHTSDDWANLSERCYDCFLMVKSMQRCRETNRALGIEQKDANNDNALSRLDYSFKNPLE